MAKANEEKSGDQLAGISAQDAKERIAAKLVLSHLTLADIRNYRCCRRKSMSVAGIEDGINEKIYTEVRNWTVAELREYLLKQKTGNDEIRRLSRGLTSEMVAAAAKLMSNLDLVQAASKMEVTSHCNITIGQKGVLSGRAQPNHPTDNIQGIKAALFEALSYGIGDAVIGINPVIDSADSVKNILQVTKEVMEKWQIPTQNCVLAQMKTQVRAIRQGSY